MIKAIRHWFWLRQLSPFWREWLRADRERKSTIPLRRLLASPSILRLGRTHHEVNKPRYLLEQ